MADPKVTYSDAEKARIRTRLSEAKGVNWKAHTGKADTLAAKAIIEAVAKRIGGAA